MNIRRSIIITGLLIIVSACTAVRTPPAATTPQRASAADATQPAITTPVQLGEVTVDWQDVSILNQPRTEAGRLGDRLYAELEDWALVSDAATDRLHVTVLEMFLRPGNRTGISSDTMTGEIELLDNAGNSKRLFRIKASYTRRGGDPVATEARLDELYAKFADLTVRELTVNQKFSNQPFETSAGKAAAL